MIGKAHEVARMTLNLEDVRTAAVAIPPKQEQCRIVDAVLEQLGRFCRLTEAVEHQLKRADRLRQSVLGSAFSGQLVPQDPTDEPAAALLDRIRAERNGSAAKKPTRRSQKELVHA
jgi:type I restriction enzyme S subunit